MRQLICVNDVEETEFRTRVESTPEDEEGMLGDGIMPRDELTALLGEGEELQVGWYELRDDEVTFIGEELPEDEEA
jgi:hypothetical protein